MAVRHLNQGGMAQGGGKEGEACLFRGLCASTDDGGIRKGSLVPAAAAAAMFGFFHPVWSLVWPCFLLSMRL
jgi:hypothetical protein